MIDIETSASHPNNFAALLLQQKSSAFSAIEYHNFESNFKGKRKYMTSSKHLSKPALFFALCGVMMMANLSVAAQSATTDTLGEGRMYFEANLWTSTQRQRNGGMQIYGGRFSYGAGKNVEVGVNASFSDPNDAEFPPEIQPNVKWKFYENEKRGITAAGGAIAFIPIARRDGTDAFVMVYTNVAKTVKPLKGARFTVGGYALLGRNRDFGSRKGWNLNYEQPLTSKVSFSTQWVTGKNRFGYVTPGLSIALGKKSSLFLGYSIGNYDYDNHGPYVSYGYYR